MSIRLMTPNVRGEISVSATIRDLCYSVCCTQIRYTEVPNQAIYARFEWLLLAG